MNRKEKKDRLGIIAVSDCILLLFLGLVYAWSVFKKPLAQAFGWNDTELTMCFTICMSFFCFGSLLAAKITRKVNHRTVVLASGTAILAAFVLASRMTALWQLYLTYGVMVGFCVGAVYNCVLSTGNTWFAGKTGLITGLFLMCFGAGSLLFGPLITMLMETAGWSLTFVILGVLFFVVFAAASFQVRMPKMDAAGQEAPADHGQEKADGGAEKEQTGLAAGGRKTENETVSFTTGEMLRHPTFWLFLLWSTLLSSIGLALVGQAATMAGAFGFGSMQASLTVSMVSACNGIGRLLFGSVYDKKGTRFTMCIIVGGSIVGTFLLVVSILNGASVLLVAAFAFMSFGYGGITPTNSNFIRDYYGPAHYPVNFSLINFNLLISSFLGQWIGSSLYLKTDSYRVTAMVMLAICVGSLLINFMVKRPENRHYNV